MSWWRSYWTDWSHKRRRSSPKNRQASEQEGVPQSRSSTYAFNVRNQQDLYHVFIDFKKAFDRVWHAALWAAMKKYSICTNQVIKNLYNNATSAILFNGSIEDWFRTTVGVWLGCVLSPTLFNILIIIITYIYNALNDALSASRIHNKLKTILSKYIHIQNRQS